MKSFSSVSAVGMQYINEQKSLEYQSVKSGKDVRRVGATRCVNF